MTKSIAAQGIQRRPNIAQHQIAGRFGQANLQQPFSFPAAAAAYTFSPPTSGYWKFVTWGAGGTGSNGTVAGSSGAYAEITKFLTPASKVSIVVPLSGDTVLTFPDGTVVTAGKAANGGGSPGVASGGDVNLAGSTGGLTGSHVGNPGLGTGGGLGGPVALGSGGAGAPANLPYRGGDGGGSSVPGTGGGGAESAGGVFGAGLVLAVFMRP